MYLYLILNVHFFFHKFLPFLKKIFIEWFLFQECKKLLTNCYRLLEFEPDDMLCNIIQEKIQDYANEVWIMDNLK